VVEGTFRLNVPAGRLRVGVQLAPGTPFSLTSELDPDAVQASLGPIGSLSPIEADALETAPFEQAIVVRPSAQSQQVPSRPIRLTLQRNNATIGGTLRDSSGAPVTGVEATVLLTPESAAGAVQFGEVDAATGQFSVGVVAGVWNLALVIDDTSGYTAPLSEQDTITVRSGATATQDVVVQRIDGVVAGQVSSDGTPLADRVVWVSGAAFAGFDVTDEQGFFSILVPTSEPDGRQASYSLGTDLRCDGLDRCYFDIDPRPALVAPLGGATNAVPQQVSRLNNIAATATLGTNVLFSARILDSRNRGVSGVRINQGDEGIADGGQLDAQSHKNINGNASVIIKYTRRPRILDAQFLVDTKEFDVSREIQGARVRPAQELATLVVEPNGGLATIEPAQFDARSGWSGTLPDGTRVEIPPGAVVLNNDEVAGDGRGLVQLTITPTSDIYPTQQFAMGGWYGVEIALRAVQSGRPITRLQTPMRVTLRYSGADKLLTDIRESRLRPARLLDGAWQVAGAFVADRGANKLTFQTRELGRWALVQQLEGCRRCYYLPLTGGR
jgi:hypothetical protein